MPARKSASPGAPSSRLRPIRRAMPLMALAALAMSTHAPAANECQVEYAYATSMTTSSNKIKDINEGQSIDISSAEGTKVLYVKNRKSRTIRVYRTGAGQYVDLASNARDPAVGNYIGGVTLQKVQCLTASAGSSQPNIQQLVANAFQAVTQATVAHINQIANWSNTVQGWAQKKASDWGSCPSQGAQDAYNQAKSYRDMIDASLVQAQKIKADAEVAKTQCLMATNNDALCGTTYNTLIVHTWISNLTAARSSINAGMATMAALQCPAGCAQTAQLSVPTASIKAGGSHNLSLPGKLNLPVCTALDLGSLAFNPSAVASGNLPQMVQAKAPSCTATTNLQVCTDWDLEALLAELKRVNIVPPTVGQITLDIPSKNITVVTGAELASCKSALEVCEPSGNVSVSLNEGKGLFGGSASCAKKIPVGCMAPPFGLQPSTTQLSVPDLTNATVRWSKQNFGSVKVDLTAPQFASMCRGRSRSFTIPRPPVISMGSTTVPLPFICTKPNMVKVVANP